MENIKGLIWDYGGTIDSRGVHWSHVLRRGWQQAGIDADEDAFRSAYVEAERELARNRHILPNHTYLDLLLIKARLELQYFGYTEPDLEDKAKIIADYCYGQARESIEEARPVLETLSKKYPMVMVSNFYGNLKAVLEDFDLLKYFPAVVESALVGVRKPNPEIFRLGLSALSSLTTPNSSLLTPNSSLVIGDSFSKDILPATQLGCPTVWLDAGQPWQPDDSAPQLPPTTRRITNLAALLNLL